MLLKIYLDEKLIKNYFIDITSMDCNFTLKGMAKIQQTLT